MPSFMILFNEVKHVVYAVAMVGEQNEKYYPRRHLFAIPAGSPYLPFLCTAECESHAML